jgi:hypothetical protein
MVCSQLFVALKGFRRNLCSHPGFPTIEKFGKGELAGVDIFAAIGAGFEADQFNLSLALCPLERVIPRQALAGDWVGSEIEFYLPGTLAAPTDMSSHDGRPPRPRFKLLKAIR